ncbi:metal transporter [Jannaschia pagri]|uniref:Metal transporter n=1 Tax=Jannaschia pagri TaxID=2829797 RepID=A0ABQ4NGE5_9RHOB|nr:MULTISPECIES: potassium channel family protein [unclassified Jannaschia]GIT90413.1 metal transporter [Jannaschia sp. AI_61]GIT93482.1 metal transporter [Jannaschia sp. AI_62]
MVQQLVIGSLLIVVTALVTAPGWWALEAVLGKLRPRIARRPHGPKLTLTLALAMLWSLAMVTVAVWIWAFAFWWLGTFETFEASVYFALVVFTTLGFGDVLMVPEWRLLGGLAAANGLLLFGLLTAMLVETLSTTRVHQREGD